MRYSEIFEADKIALGLYDPDEDILHQKNLGDVRKSKITLRDLHRLKIIKRNRRKELDRKLELVCNMYRDPDAELQSREKELDQMERELEIQKAEIELIVNKAEIDRDQKDHIENLAMNTVVRAMKK